MRAVFWTFGWSERQAGCAAHHLALLVGEHAFEAVGVDDGLALVGRHRPKIAHSSGHHALTIGRELPHLAEDLPSLLFLLGGEMFPGLHAVQHAQLLLRREIGKVLQSLAQPVLSLRRQAAERGIVLQCAFLFFRRQIFVPTKPVAGVSTNRQRSLRLPWCL